MRGVHIVHSEFVAALKTIFFSPWSPKQCSHICEVLMRPRPRPHGAKIWSIGKTFRLCGWFIKPTKSLSIFTTPMLLSWASYFIVPNLPSPVWANPANNSNSGRLHTALGSLTIPCHWSTWTFIFFSCVLVFFTAPLTGLADILQRFHFLDKSRDVFWNTYFLLACGQGLRVGGSQ